MYRINFIPIHITTNQICHYCIQCDYMFESRQLIRVNIILKIIIYNQLSLIKNNYNNSNFSSSKLAISTPTLVGTT